MAPKALSNCFLLFQEVILGILYSQRTLEQYMVRMIVNVEEWGNILKSMEELKEMGDVLLNALQSGVGVLGTDAGGKPCAVIVVSNDLIKKGIKAGYLAKIIGNEMDGGGGGKPHLATAGGKNSKLYKAAMKKSVDLITIELKKVMG